MDGKERNVRVDQYLAGATVRRQEMEALREICLESGLTEEFKWGKPCYTFHGRNIVLIQGFKKYSALLFFKGAVMDDQMGLLVKTGENTREGRQIRFQGVDEIAGMREMLKRYIILAMEARGDQ